MAIKFPRLGTYIAELEVEAEGAIRYEQTTDDSAHHTLWGEPDAIRTCVIRVVGV